MLLSWRQRAKMLLQFPGEEDPASRWCCRTHTHRMHPLSNTTLSLIMHFFHTAHMKRRDKLVCLKGINVAEGEGERAFWHFKMLKWSKDVFILTKKELLRKQVILFVKVILFFFIFLMSCYELVIWHAILLIHITSFSHLTCSDSTTGHTYKKNTQWAFN